MLHKCANPACPSVFRSLRHGKLFLLEIETRDGLDFKHLGHEPERTNCPKS